MNVEQTKTLVRWGVTAFGATAAGYIAGKGWASANDVLGVLTSDTFVQGIGAVVALISLVWGLFAHTEKNAVAVANDMPNVAGVVTADTPAGKQLARSIPGPTVSPAGSLQAKALAAGS